ncbi:adenine deaminase [Pontibacillus marinus]|uniref:Adenine deaminase n=1 Tax=Pontibacillus marinus BH030004 = DSM 16465 TaxID=1385511 RepID=A0A0A5GEA5_9BACI|nr:adenine deaminase [Pontibacillus marinus]KGX89533.1 adenine deaminase [Pontibacillus marinus BH030004 = DSM 16465]
MTSQKEQISKRIKVANKQQPADMVIKNGRIVDVFNQEIVEEDVAIVDGIFVGLGEFDGERVIDAQGKYVCPGFIDGHVHIESSMVKPSEFSKVVLPHGVTSVITDPHEIANVSGEDGIQFMIDDAKTSLLDVYFMIPSSVPATPMENNGAHLGAKKLAPFYEQADVIGLAEVMDYPAVANASEDMIEKLYNASAHKLNIDGHAAGFGPDELNVYKAAGIRTDHECNTGEEALARVRRGMHVLIREGSASKDLTSIISVVNHRNAHRFLFCTDDKGLDELIDEGSIDHNVRLSIRHGVEPIQSIQMATLNAAQCYGLDRKGAIAPGYDADFLLLEDLETIRIGEVYKEGTCVAVGGNYVGEDSPSIEPGASITNSVNLPNINLEDLRIPINSSKSAHVMEVIPNCLLTNKLVMDVDEENGYFLPSLKRDQAKLAVIERHQRTGNMGLGIVKGLHLEKGAIASTVAHDSHNLVVAGMNDLDMQLAINHLKEVNGGFVIVKDKEILASIPFDIAGLMSKKDYSTVNQKLRHLHNSLQDVMKKDASFNPFLTLSFLTLPVIPELKLTDKGLFDVTKHKHIPIEVERMFV